jgi:hypothetical protein
MAIQIQAFPSPPKPPTPHPTAEATVPPLWKVIGGGAIDSWSGAGNLLTASYPTPDKTKWKAAGKDHEVSSPAVIRAYAIAIFDPNNEWDVQIVQSAPSSPAPHPSAFAAIPPGYLLTGGGAYVDWKGAGNLLTASFPSSETTWEVRSKDHDISSPSTITAYAIGLKHKQNKIKLARTVVPGAGNNGAHPTAQACLPPGWFLSGGGAIDNWNGAGNLLTASYPVDNCWKAAGKDHMHASQAAITAFAIGIRQV